MSSRLNVACAYLRATAPRVLIEDMFNIVIGDNLAKTGWLACLCRRVNMPAMFFNVNVFFITGCGYCKTIFGKTMR